MQEVRGFFTLGHLLYAYAPWHLERKGVQVGDLPLAVRLCPNHRNRLQFPYKSP